MLVVDGDKMIEALSRSSGNAFCTVNSTPLTLLSNILSKCSSVIAPKGSMSPRSALDVCTGYIYHAHMASKFDPNKDAANIVKHGLSLVEGEGVLSDPLGLTVEDESSQGEVRWTTIGMNANGVLLVVVWTERDDGERLISVRRPTTMERKDYEE